MTGTALEVVSFLMEQDKAKQWCLEEYSEKKSRNLSQNALYWKILARVASKLHVTNNFLHNTLLREISVPFIIDGQMARVTLPDTEETENNLLEAMTYHLKPTSQVWTGADGITYRTYIMLKGSSDYSVKEFSVLVDRLFEIAHENNVETISDDELAHIRELELNREKKHE